jgi:hypothetical protein
MSSNMYQGRVVQNLIDTVSGYNRTIKLELLETWSQVPEYVDESALHHLYYEQLGEELVKAAYSWYIGVPVVKMDIYKDCILIDIHNRGDKSRVAFNAARYPREIIIRCIE